MPYAGLSQVAWSLALAQDNRRTSDTSLSSKITTVKSAKTIRTSDSDDVHVVQAEESDVSTLSLSTSAPRDMLPSELVEAHRNGLRSLGPSTSYWDVTTGTAPAQWFDDMYIDLMQGLLQQHQQKLQQLSKGFIADVQQKHAKLLQELGCAKDLKGLLKLVSEYTDTVQRLAVDSHREHSKANTAFGQEMTETACNAFVRSVEVAVEAKDELHSKKVIAMTAEHSKALSAFRASAATELATALHLQAKQVQQASAEQLQRVQSQLQAQCAAVATDAERYRAQAEYTNREVMKLREELAAARQDVHMWRMKWEKEAGKSEGLKSTAHAMQGAEEQIAKLMQQHQQEMRQRDDVLRRCRDTILGLEAKLADAKKLQEQHQQQQ
eukprot:jgi/Chrzof1/1416/Cz10g07070.t1